MVLSYILVGCPCVSSTYNYNTYTSVLQQNPCVTNTTVSQVNLTNTADNAENSWCGHKSITRSKKIYNLVLMSQLNTVNNTDTVIDLNLNPLHLIDQPFSMDQIRDKYSAIKKRTNQWRKGNLKNEAETRCQSNTQKWFDHRLIKASKCHSGLSTLS